MGFCEGNGVFLNPSPLHLTPIVQPSDDVSIAYADVKGGNCCSKERKKTWVLARSHNTLCATAPTGGVERLQLSGRVPCHGVIVELYLAIGVVHVVSESEDPAYASHAVMWLNARAYACRSTRTRHPSR